MPSRTTSIQHVHRLTRFAPIVFAIAGALSRFALPQVETRLHIIWFWVAALWVQFFVQSVSRARVSMSLLLLNGAAASFAILLTKFALEGLPSYVGKALTRFF